MKIINDRFHGIIDYVVVIFLLVSPSLFGLSALVSLITYALAGVHLMLTVLTNFRYGVIKLISFKIHGWIELVVSVVLVIAPWIVGFSHLRTDVIFYIGFGIAVFLTWLLTDYSKSKVEL